MSKSNLLAALLGRTLPPTELTRAGRVGGKNQMRNKPNKSAGVPGVAVQCMVVRRRRDLWNKCHECGRIISYDDFASGQAINRLITPDSDVSSEAWEILCRKHYKLANDQGELRAAERNKP